MTDTFYCDDCGAQATPVYDRPGDESSAFDVYCAECAWQMYVPEAAAARSRIAKLRSIVSEHRAQRIDGFIVDVVTATMLVNVYKALSPQARESFGKPRLDRLVDLGWKAVRR